MECTEEEEERTTLVGLHSRITYSTERERGCMRMECTVYTEEEEEGTILIRLCININFSKVIYASESQ